MEEPHQSHINATRLTNSSDKQSVETYKCMLGYNRPSFGDISLHCSQSYECWFQLCSCCLCFKI